jgi:hypothetical protein
MKTLTTVSCPTAASCWIQFLVLSIPSCVNERRDKEQRKKGKGGRLKDYVVVKSCGRSERGCHSMKMIDGSSIVLATITYTTTSVVAHSYLSLYRPYRGTTTATRLSIEARRLLCHLHI